MAAIDISKEHQRLTEILKKQQKSLDTSVENQIKAEKNKTASKGSKEVIKEWAKGLTKDIESVIDDEICQWSPL